MSRSGNDLETGGWSSPRLSAVTPEERLERYAQLAVGVGANVQPGQVVEVWAHPEHIPLVRAVARAAYAAGAAYVTVEWRDPYLRRALVDLGPEETLDWSPPWEISKFEWLAENRAAFINIEGDPDPNALEGLDARRLGRAVKRAFRRSLNEALPHLNWTIVAYPNAGWATSVFGAPDVERLWDLVGRATRLDEDDPVAAWETHLNRLDERAQMLNAAHFDAVRFSGPGTDLLVGLTERSRWRAGRDETSYGLEHVANLPTEEVFATPDARRTEGTLRCTRPVALPGNVAEDVELTFTAGLLTQVRARKGEAELREALKLDEGAGRLGEVALVDGTSRVGQLATTFYDTIFDENAACHVALGNAYLDAVEGGAELAAHERLALGVNESLLHLDVMLGGLEVDVDGLDSGGKVTPIIRDDAWVLEPAVARAPAIVEG